MGGSNAPRPFPRSILYYNNVAPHSRLTVIPTARRSYGSCAAASTGKSPPRGGIAPWSPSRRRGTSWVSEMVMPRIKVDVLQRSGCPLSFSQRNPSYSDVDDPECSFNSWTIFLTFISLLQRYKLLCQPTVCPICNSLSRQWNIKICQQNVVNELNGRPVAKKRISRFNAPIICRGPLRNCKCRKSSHGGAALACSLNTLGGHPVRSCSLFRTTMHVEQKERSSLSSVHSIVDTPQHV